MLDIEKVGINNSKINVNIKLIFFNSYDEI